AVEQQVLSRVSRKLKRGGKPLTSPPAGCSPSKLGWNRAKSQCHLCGAQSYG
ncbi:hypothetical protein TNCV_4356081, partial [Trichonephila clavipes]